MAAPPWAPSSLWSVVDLIRKMTQRDILALNSPNHCSSDAHFGARLPLGQPPPWPYRDGKTHVISEPLDFIVRLEVEALVPKLRVNLTRFSGAFAPKNKYRQPVGWAAAGCPLRISRMSPEYRSF